MTISTLLNPFNSQDSGGNIFLTTDLKDNKVVNRQDTWLRKLTPLIFFSSRDTAPINA